MVSVEDAVIARIKKEGKEFEILVDCDKAIEYKQGKETDLSNVLAVEEIFSDAKKGLVAGGLEEVFGTSDILEIAEKIILKGEVQLTQEYRKKLHERKVNQVINTITTNAYDPRTNAPIPPERLRLALEQARVSIDVFKSDKELLQEITESLKKILPISFEKRRFKIIIPAKYAMKAYSFVNKYKISENWLSNGDLDCSIEVLGGLVPDMYSKLNNITSGNVEIKEVN